MVAIIAWIALTSAMTAKSQAFTASDGGTTNPYYRDVPYSSSLSGPPPSLEEESASLPDAPDITAGYRMTGGRFERPAPGLREPRPFHSYALGLTLGSGGIGVQLATPLTRKFNLRTDASFFSYDTSFVVDSIPITGHLHLSNISASLDWAPLGRDFHISPGVTVYENTNFSALINIPGNQIITLNDQNYTSDPNDPIRGTALVDFGKNVAPRLTIGYGNVIRHHTAGFTFPVEIGFEYIRTPTATFDLTGSDCDSAGSCDPINNDPATQQNIQEQRQEINDDIKVLRIFPIFSFGISYKFGH